MILFILFTALLHAPQAPGPLVTTAWVASHTTDANVVVISSDDERQFAAGHIPGAISVPLADLPKRMRELQKRRDVVAYCRGPYCVMALDAVDLLRRKGFRAHRLEHGVPEWRARGWRVDSGDRHQARG